MTRGLSRRSFAYTYCLLLAHSPARCVFVRVYIPLLCHTHKRPANCPPTTGDLQRITILFLILAATSNAIGQARPSIPAIILNIRLYTFKRSRIVRFCEGVKTPQFNCQLTERCPTTSAL